MRLKRAREQATSIRETYVQSNLMWGKGGGISLDDLRDLVAATADYDPGSRVLLEEKRVTVTETLRTPWAEKGAGQ